ncbi:hypothetical protein [Gelidibacter japonicus]|uniref:hypothetical protein n=1 Tax=Gelidibacter japonicus TaxID=1962232 RepID=UPI003A944041
MKYTILLVCSIITIGCGKSFDTVSSLPYVNEINLEDYDLYVFQLKTLNQNSDSNLTPIVFENSVTANSNEGLIWEELYILMEKEGSNVLYFTTFSDKYVDSISIFNNPKYEGIIPIRNIDYMYNGKIRNQAFHFYNPKGRRYSENVIIDFKKEDNVLTLIAITNDYAKEKDRLLNPKISLNDLFGVNINFKKENRIWVYEHVDVNNDSNTGIYDTISKVYVNANDFYFDINKNPAEYKFFKDRVRLTMPPK